MYSSMLPIEGILGILGMRSANELDEPHRFGEEADAFRCGILSVDGGLLIDVARNRSSSGIAPDLAVRKGSFLISDILFNSN